MAKIKPKLKLNGIVVGNNEYWINFYNVGGTAQIQNYNITPDDIEVDKQSLPIKLKTGEDGYIRLKIPGKPDLTFKYQIGILYSDTLERRYRTIINGQSILPEIISTELLTNE